MRAFQFNTPIRCRRMFSVRFHNITSVTSFFFLLLGAPGWVCVHNPCAAAVGVATISVVCVGALCVGADNTFLLIVWCIKVAGREKEESWNVYSLRVCCCSRLIFIVQLLYLSSTTGLFAFVHAGADDQWRHHSLAARKIWCLNVNVCLDVVWFKCEEARCTLWVATYSGLKKGHGKKRSAMLLLN